MTEVSENAAVALVRRIGRACLSTVRQMGRMVVFLVRALFCLVTPPLKVRRVLGRIQFIGFKSLVVICLAGAFTGMVLGFQGYHTLTRFGSTAFLGPMVGLSLLKELGPVLTALMVTGRAGSAIAAEIGIMRIDEEIDALELMGLSPFRYVVAPALLAGVICLPLLTALFNCLGIFGGYLVGVRLLGVGAGTYFGEMADYVRMSDILEGMYKSLSFGGFMAWICCYKGYYAGFGAEGVSKVTTQAVVLSSVVILMWDYFMTAVFF